MQKYMVVYCLNYEGRICSSGARFFDLFEYAIHDRNRAMHMFDVVELYERTSDPNGEEYYRKLTEEEIKERISKISSGTRFLRR